MKSISYFLLFTILFLSYQSTIYQVARRFTLTVTGGTVMYYSTNNRDFVEEEIEFADTDVVGHDQLTISFIGLVYDKREYEIGEYSRGQSEDRLVFKHKKETLGGTFTLAYGSYEYAIQGEDTRHFTRKKFIEEILETQITYRDPDNLFKVTLDFKAVDLHVKQFSFALVKRMFTSLQDGIIADNKDEVSELDTTSEQSSTVVTSVNSLDSQQSMNSITEEKNKGQVQDDDDRMLRSRSKITKQVISELGEFFGKLTRDSL